jgi:hypothetical protein
MNDEQTNVTAQTGPDDPGSETGENYTDMTYHEMRHQMRAERHAEREQWRAERHAHRWGGPWLGGAILIALGFIFLAQNLGIAVFQNWWALFVLIPAITSLGTAWNIYKANDHQWTGAARGPLVTGLILLVITATLLFGLNWGLIVPLLLIIAGVAALLNGMQGQ